jgi:nucleotide-binding universal stress UspA family protein
MSIFPTKILLATDGSEEAKLAFASAADLSEKTGSELHVVYVGHMPIISFEYPSPTTLDPDFWRRLQENAEILWSATPPALFWWCASKEGAKGLEIALKR